MTAVGRFVFILLLAAPAACRTVPERPGARSAPEAAPASVPRPPQDSSPGTRVPHVIDAWVLAQQAEWDSLPLTMPDTTSVQPTWQNTSERMAAGNRCGGHGTYVAPDLIWISFDEAASVERRLFIVDSIQGRIKTRLTRSFLTYLVWIRPNGGCDMLSLSHRLKRVAGVRYVIPDMSISCCAPVVEKVPVPVRPPPLDGRWK